MGLNFYPTLMYDKSVSIPIIGMVAACKEAPPAILKLASRSYLEGESGSSNVVVEKWDSTMKSTY